MSQASAKSQVKAASWRLKFRAVAMSLLSMIGSMTAFYKA